MAELQGADAILIGAGSGLSASAGLTYGGERFWVRQAMSGMKDPGQ